MSLSRKCEPGFCRYVDVVMLRFDLKCSKSKALHDSFTHHASIVWNCLPSQFKSKPSYSFLKASIKRFAKCIDQINFGTNSTATNTNSDEFMYY